MAEINRCFCTPDAMCGPCISRANAKAETALRPALDKLRDDYADLFELDVAQFPDAYKESVRRNPRGFALGSIEGLSAHDVGLMVKALRDERRAIARLMR